MRSMGERRGSGRGAPAWAVGLSAIPAVLALTGCTGGVVLDACPAIGYLYRGPAVVEFSEPVPAAATVVACFGDDCTPSRIEPNGDDRWEVPQESPYLGPGRIGDGSELSLRVVVTEGDHALVDGLFVIPVVVERAGIFGQCPGPFRFEPVEVPLPTAMP